jgi:hypothetical protein
MRSTFSLLTATCLLATGLAAAAPTATYSYRAYIAGNSVVWDDYSPVR